MSKYSYDDSRCINYCVFYYYVRQKAYYIYVVFHSRGFFDVPRVLIADARSFQALAAILDYVTHLDSMSWWYRSDDRQNEMTVLKLLHCEFQKNEVMTMSVVDGQAKKTRKYQL